jgi:hypothetical protein
MAVSVCRSLSWKLLRGVYVMSDAVDSFVFTLSATKLLVVQDCVGGAVASTCALTTIGGM